MNPVLTINQKWKIFPRRSKKRRSNGESIIKKSNGSIQFQYFISSLSFTKHSPLPCYVTIQARRGHVTNFGWAVSAGTSESSLPSHNFLQFSPFRSEDHFCPSVNPPSDSCQVCQFKRALFVTSPRQTWDGTDLLDFSRVLKKENLYFFKKKGRPPFLFFHWAILI